jgi:hypothetical protein
MVTVRDLEKLRKANIAREREIAALVERNKLHVKFSRAMNLSEFFAVAGLLAKIPGMPFKTIDPMDAVRNGEHDNLVLKGNGVTIEIEHGVGTAIASERVTSVGFGSAMLDRDWEISFDDFSGVKVTLYRHRGRPRRDLVKAQIRGAKAEGKSWKEAGAPHGLSADAARHLVTARNVTRDA